MICPKCGNHVYNTITETKSKGGSSGFIDACCGFFLLGPIGLLCGACGHSNPKVKSKSYWICNNCGYKFTANKTNAYRYGEKNEDDVKTISYANNRTNSLKSNDSDTWKCTCGNINPIYLTTCSCGTKKEDIKSDWDKQLSKTPRNKIGSSTTNRVWTTDWLCYCGRENPNSVSKCICGLSKEEAIKKINEIKNNSEKHE